MGHIRLGAVPKSQPWQAVVRTLAAQPSVGTIRRSPAGLGAGGVDTASVAAATLDAAGAALNRAVDDPGVRYTFYLLTQVVLATRTKDWVTSLRRVGIALRSSATIFDLASAFQEAVDQHIVELGTHSDFSELAQKAAGEALCDLASDKATTLFGDSGEELRQAVRTLSTKTGFSQLGQRFFGRFLAYFLNFYVSRISAGEVGSRALPSLGAISKLDRGLIQHCDQSAAILHDFAGEWFSKANYDSGIDPSRAGRFVAVAITKLQAELRAQRAGK
jgi:hypothetical protein